MENLCIIIRQLTPESPPVVTHVTNIPEYVDDPQHYCESILHDVKGEFCLKFIEFDTAKWYYQHWR